MTIKLRSFLYDFGCIKQISDKFKLNFIAILKKLKSDEPIEEEFFNLGFNRFKSRHATSKLNDICEILFYPFLENRPISISEWSVSKKMVDLLGDDRYEIRHSGTGELLYIMRSFQGLIRYLEILDCKINWFQVIEPYLNNIEREVECQMK